MANTISSIIYDGYVYKVGDTLKLKNNTLYPSITASSGNNVNMLNQCVMKIVNIWEGSSSGVAVKNPLQLSWVSGPSGSYNGGGYARLDQIVSGSGGSPTITNGNLAVYAYDQRTNNTAQANEWAESFYIDWNSFGSNNGNSIVKYEIWYSEAPDAGNKPGTWSGRNWVREIYTSESSGHTIVGTLNQNRSESDWGGRGYWYRFSVVAVGKNGGHSSATLWTNALRKSNVYTYTINLNGGTGVSPVKQYKFSGYKFKMPNAPSKTGNTFLNWSYNSNTYNPSQMVNTPNSNITITANWNINKYQITYKANGGSGSDVTQQVTYGQNFTTKSSNTFSRIGYTFQNWLVNNNPSDSCGANTTHVYQWTNNISMYASWKVNIYTLTINPNGGTWNGSSSQQSFNQAYGTTKTISTNPTKTGYTFTGWSLSGKGSINGQTFTFSDGNAVLTAQWKISQCTITYMPNGGTGTNQTQTVEYGLGCYIRGAIFSRTGYTLDSWNTSPSGNGVRYNLDAWQSSITKDITLYAIWQINTWTVSYDANGGINAPSSQTKYYNESLTLSYYAPTKTGYTFLYWNTSIYGSGTTYYPGDSYTLNSNVTLYAQWIVNTYTVKFDANGGNCSISSKNVNYNNSIGTLPVAKRTGYIFNGWYTSSSSGLKIDESYLITDNITLYAHWTVKTASNTFWRNFDRYDNTYMTKNYTYDSYGQYFPDYWTRTGYTFLGWNNDRTANEAIFSPNESVSNAWIDSSYPSADLFAIWNINQYTLTINPNGGTWDGYYGEESFTQNYNSTMYIQDPIRTGYTFKGWLLSGYGYLSDRTFTFGEGNTTLTAQWEIIKYSVKFDANSGLINGTQSSLIKKINHGDSLGILPIAEKEFYKFIGWFTSPTGGIQINSNTVVTKNITYYAHYESRFYVYTGGKWVKGNLYNCSGNTWKPTTLAIRIENQWK